MKSIMQIAAITIFISHFAHSQSAVQEAIDRHTIIDTRMSHPQAVFSSIQRDVRNAGPEYFGLNEEDTRQLFKILEIDRAKVEREALFPYMQEICQAVRNETSNMGELASIFIQAVSAEENAIKAALDSISSTLSNDGFVKFENEIKSRTTEKAYRIVDWAGLAAEKPELLKEILTTACTRFYQAEEALLLAPERNFVNTAEDNEVTIKAD
jgi:hypothetical protein